MMWLKSRRVSIDFAMDPIKVYGSTKAGKYYRDRLDGPYPRNKYLMHDD